MKTKVRKRKGGLEDFQEEKIARVVKAAGLTEEKARALAQKVAAEVRAKNVEIIDSSEIRGLVTAELKEADEYAYGLYVWYEKMKDRDGH